MDEEDFEQCPHCGEIIVRGSLHAHIDKKKCLQKGEAEIFEELRKEGLKCTDKTKFELVYKKDDFFTGLKRLLTRKRPAWRKYAWIWIPYGKDDDYIDQLHELEKTHEIRWMTEG